MAQHFTPVEMCRDTLLRRPVVAIFSIRLCTPENTRPSVQTGTEMTTAVSGRVTLLCRRPPQVLQILRDIAGADALSAVRADREDFVAL